MVSFSLAVVLLAGNGRAGMETRGIDASMPAIAAAKLWESAPAELKIEPGTWLRLRENGLQFLGKTDGAWRSVNPAKEAETKSALRQLRARGFRIMALIELTHHDWPGGVHVASGTRMAANLNDVAGYARALPAAYEGLVDAWEVENEPDLGFVSSPPESYAAYLKAFYLGFQRGFAEAGVKGYRLDVRGSQTGVVTTSNNDSLTPNPSTPVVLMGALGLPPGPWIERFAANDGFSYTDGFAYHYYGYAADFTPVYRQFEQMAGDFSRRYEEANPENMVRKRLPVYLTEAGYGLLGVDAGASKEGRVRQWRWFASIGQQAAELKLVAATAFVLKPYPAYGATELGLTQGVNSGPAPSYDASDFGSHRGGAWSSTIGLRLGDAVVTPALAWWLARSGRASGKASEWRWSVPKVSPVVIDFLPEAGLQPVKRYHGSFVVGLPPETKPAPPPKGPGSFQQPPGAEFMLHVRTANGNLYEIYPTRKATPDWQSFLEPRDNFTASFYGRASLPWRFEENQPAALVAVLYPRELPVTYEFRRPRLVRFEPRDAPSGKEGRGRVVLYNFSDAAVTGRLLFPVAVEGERREVPITLAAGERREVPVEIVIPDAGVEPVMADFEFVPDGSTVPRARFQTKFLPDLAGRAPQTTRELLAPAAEAASSRNYKLSASRVRVAEEAPMEPSAGIFAQAGATIARTEDGFAITVTAMPAGAGQRIEVEMPWPDAVGFNAGEFLAVDYRLRR